MLFTPAATGATPDPAAPATQEVKAERCDLGVDSWVGTKSDFTYWAPFYESIVTVRIRVTPETCTWRIDSSGKPSWIRAVVVAGNSVGRGYYRGPGTVEIRWSKNSGYARSGRFRFATASYSVAVDVGQKHYTGACLFKPAGASGTQAKTIAQGFISVAKSMATPAGDFVAQITDSSSCPTSPRPVAFTFGMNGTTITPVPGRNRTFDIRRPGVQANLNGEGALLALNDPGFAQPSGVLAMALPTQESLPPDLRITRQTTSTEFLSFGDGGGVVEVTGRVTRASRNADRPCPFIPGYYQVIGGASSGGWLSLTSESGCTGSPDSGRLMVAAQPNASGRPRVGAVFSPWGTVIFVLQAAG